MRKSRRCLCLLLLLASSFVSAFAQLVVARQVPANPLSTNVYLMYDPQSSEAALVDVGGPVDSLLSVIDLNALDLKYILVTHAHPDHVAGIPAVMKRFPRAKVCVSEEEREDARRYARWRQELDPKFVARVSKDSQVVALMDFDFENSVHPALDVKEGDTYLLGRSLIRALRSPGHSRGSICYYVDNMLFSGDVLFHRRVGSSDFPGSGGWDSLVVSVRRLYAVLPDTTVVYPGHGKATDIGSEKRENPRISEQAVHPR